MSSMNIHNVFESLSVTHKALYSKNSNKEEGFEPQLLEVLLWPSANTLKLIGFYKLGCNKKQLSEFSSNSLKNIEYPYFKILMVAVSFKYIFLVYPYFSLWTIHSFFLPFRASFAFFFQPAVSITNDPFILFQTEPKGFRPLALLPVLPGLKLFPIPLYLMLTRRIIGHSIG